MNTKEFLAETSLISGLSLEEAERFYLAMVKVFQNTLGSGQDIELAPEFARFKVKLSDNPSLHENSPRTPKATKYTVKFMPGKELKKSLLVNKDQ